MMEQLIQETTRVTDITSSLLDIILTNVPEKHEESGVVQTTLSDHYLIWTKLNNKIEHEKV